MKNLTLKKNILKGEITIPASKSMLHRAIIAGCLSNNKVKIYFDTRFLSEDIKATISCLSSLSYDIRIFKDYILVNENKRKYEKEKDITFNCNESGSTLRFMIPISLLEENEKKFIGSEKLLSRPLMPYFNIFNEHNIKYKLDKTSLSIFKNQKLNAEYFKIDGNISSQFISGLLFVLPFLENDSTIEIINNLESKSYILMTLDILKTFNIDVKFENDKIFYIRGKQKYIAKDIKIEPDFSQAAFFVVAQKICTDIKILNIDNEVIKNSLQGDKKIIELVEKIENNKEEEQLEIDGKNIPDIIPILSLYASISKGFFTFNNLERLKLKESDRLKATVDTLYKLGANIHTKENKIFIKGLGSHNAFKSANLSSYNDHRIAMMIAIASLCLNDEEKIILDDGTCVAKSYPNFWEDFKMLGGKVSCE